MVKHAMNIGESVTEFLNPGQTPVIGMDQPIYAIGKQIQWKWTDLSGFASVINEAGVLTSGRAEAVSSPTADHHLKRTRYVHQVFLMAGSILKKEAYDAYQLQEGPHDKDSWDVDMRDASQQFAYWSMPDGPGSGDATLSLCMFTSRRRF